MTETILIYTWWGAWFVGCLLLGYVAMTIVDLIIARITRRRFRRWTTARIEEAENRCRRDIERNG